MENLRIYGPGPYDLVLLHGGPGAPGEMSGIAKSLSATHSILEPLLFSLSIKEQLEEINSILNKYSINPVILIGHSWGAWLSLIFASSYPGFIKKLIMVGTPPFEEKYVPRIRETRLMRLTIEEKREIKRTEQQLKYIFPDNNSIMTKYIRLLSEVDSYELIPSDDDETLFYPSVCYKIWEEASQLRKNGTLIRYANNIKCPVVAIHGDFDPHPVNGVNEPLSGVLKSFRMILIEKCGHYPWKEKYAKDIFYKIISEEILMP